MKKKSKASPPDERERLLQSMRIAQAVLTNDVATMATMLQESLPQKPTTGDVSIEKSVGEAFTGGRSTPVYFVKSSVCKWYKSPIQRSFVVKLVVMDSNQVQKRESYAVERRFYEFVSEQVRTAGLMIPRLLASDLDGSKPWPVFCILMNDVSMRHPIHPNFMSLAQARAALKWLAHFHALFYQDVKSASWHMVLWDRGAFWTKTINVEGVASTWNQTVKFLETKHAALITPSMKNLGKRIQCAAPAISSLLTRTTAEHGTLIHGDYKAANLFFSQENHVAVVDFQYAGLGVGAEDVAYLLYPDANGDWFDYQDVVLEIYHDEFIQQLMLLQKGGPSSMPFQTFRQLYELARIDMTRYWLDKGWVASTLGEAKLVSDLVSTMDRIDGAGSLTNASAYESAIAKLLEDHS